MDPQDLPNLDDTKDLYDSSANKWKRSEKVILSDFTARPVVLQQAQPLEGMRVLDLGCGEGFVSRMFRKQGAASVLGVDISDQMVERAREAEQGQSRGIEYRVAELPDFDPGGERVFDRIAAVFLFNYITSEAMEQVMAKARTWLAPGGRFIFTVPHPSLPFMGEKERPFYFDPGRFDYFSGQDAEFKGMIWRRDGIPCDVRCVHKPLEVYFNALSRSGWTRLPVVRELRVLDEHLALDPEFFTPLIGKPLHLLFQLEL